MDKLTTDFSKMSVDKYSTVFENYVQEGADKNNNDDDDSDIDDDLDLRALSLEELDEIMKNMKKEIKEMDDEYLAKEKQLEEIRAARALAREENQKKVTKIREDTRKLEREYEKKKHKTREMEKECDKLKGETEGHQMKYAFWEEVFKGMGVDVGTKTCSEGKPIDNSGAPGTCNVWDCPKLMEKLENDGGDKTKMKNDKEASSSSASSSTSNKRNTRSSSYSKQRKSKN